MYLFGLNLQISTNHYKDKNEVYEPFSLGSNTKYNNNFNSNYTFYVV